MSDSGLAVSEVFYSIQGEGPTMGVPAVFLRLKGCNLTCGGVKTVQSKGLDSGATWRCDTIETWLSGDVMSNSEILQDWKSKGYLDAFQNGAHLVITGGEPLLQQDALINFFVDLDLVCEGLPYCEIETNGTIFPEDDLADCISQFNVSPKLTNSGMTKSKRYASPVLSHFSTIDGAFFKFVVSSESDCDEILTDFVQPLQLDPRVVYLMPAASSSSTLIQKSQDLVEWCKRYGFRYSSRLQVSLWDRTVGK